MATAMIRGRSTIVAVAVALAWLAVGADMAAASGWMIDASPALPAQAFASPVLTGVSCPTDQSCVAVGELPGAMGVNTVFAEHGTGEAWTVDPVPIPAGGSFPQLLGVSCSSRVNCIAVGSTSLGVLVERWDGSVWTVQNAPSPTQRFSILYAVSCPRATACHAVGLAGLGSFIGPLAETWNGSTWTIDSLPGNLPVGTLTSISCTAGNACTAASQEALIRWNGAAWSAQPVVTPPTSQGSYEFDGVSCARAASCIAVGADVSTAGTMPVAERWNGVTWSLSLAPVPTSAATLDGVSCPRRSVCTAVGGGSAGAVAQRWRRHRWTPQGNPASTQQPGAVLNSVSCPTVHTCTAVGALAVGATVDTPLIERWSGS
jgi:hypothetical protein